ncbi:MAG TPA: HlyD family secretion protein, partial [Crenalkalicoccus sp.]|nr:HlyD family secretion protein [Crenalkalicoccus sp.]
SAEHGHHAWRGLLVPLLLVLLAAGLAALFTFRWNAWTGLAATQSTDDAYLQSDLTPLSARIVGYVRAVPVQDYQVVKAGDVVLQIADEDYRAQVQQAEANLAAAQATLETLRAQRTLQDSNVRAAQAAVQGQQAVVQRNRLEDDRQRALLTAGGLAGTRQLVEQADANLQQSSAQLAQMQAQAEAAQRQTTVQDAQIRQQEAQLQAAQAALDLARINLGYTRIRAPEDGMLAQRAARPGQYVATGTQVNALVPLSRQWVIANFKETQMTRLRPGQPARVTVDAFPGLVLKGRVESWSPASGAQFSLLPPDNATGNFTKVVQRIPVKITLDLQDEPRAALLRPGMSVVARVETGRGE